MSAQPTRASVREYAECRFNGCEIVVGVKEHGIWQGRTRSYCSRHNSPDKRHERQR